MELEPGPSDGLALAPAPAPAPAKYPGSGSETLVGSKKMSYTLESSVSCYLLIEDYDFIYLKCVEQKS